MQVLLTVIRDDGTKCGIATTIQTPEELDAALQLLCRPLTDRLNGRSNPSGDDMEPATAEAMGA